MDHHPHPLLVCQQHHLATRQGNKLNSHYWKDVILYSGKLSREKTFTNFVVLWLFGKVFSAKFGGVVSFSMARAINPQKFSPQKSYFSPIRGSFLPQNFQLYGSSTCCSPVMCAKHYLQLSLWTKFHVLINTMEYQAHYCVQGTHSPIPSHLSLIPSLPPFLPPSSLPFILYLSIPPTSLLPPSNISAPTL